MILDASAVMVALSDPGVSASFVGHDLVAPDLIVPDRAIEHGHSPLAPPNSRNSSITPCTTASISLLRNLATTS